MHDKTGGPAFPAQMVNDDPDERYSTPTLGMTLRDYFAAAAMQALHGNPSDIFTHSLVPPERQTDAESRDYARKRIDTLAATVYAIADAMLAEREKHGN